MDTDSDEGEMSGTWKFVGQGNDTAFMKAINGDQAGALADLDAVRGSAILMAEMDPARQNEIECRRLEMRLLVAGQSEDVELLWKVMKEIGQSKRFSSERLHEFMEVASSIVGDVAGRKPQ